MILSTFFFSNRFKVAIDVSQRRASPFLSIRLLAVSFCMLLVMFIHRVL